MSRQIYFKDLPDFIQQRILDSFGADCAADLGLDRKPYATIYEDSEGVGAIGVFEPAQRLTYIYMKTCVDEIGVALAVLQC